MKIIYSPYYDGDIFLGDSPKFMGETYVGNNGLLQQLQLRAGVHHEPKPDVEREADYHNAMMPHIPGTIFAKSVDVDPFGVASKLLRWRDALIIAGWDGTFPDSQQGIIAVLASIEKDFKSIGIADCWKIICGIYSQGVHVDHSIDSIRIDCPWSEIPCIIQKTLSAIKDSGIEVFTTIEDGVSDSAIKTESVKLLEFDDVNDAYEWYATIEKMPENTVVINRDNVRLNHTLYTWNKPLAHSSLKDSNPQLLQLFKLSMSIFSRPLNIQNLVSYMMLPMSPIPGKLRRQLARLLLSTGGFGEKLTREDGKVRDDWEEIIENFEFLGKDGNDSPQAKGHAKAKKLPFLEPIRKNYANGIDKLEISGYVENLKKWINGHYADEDLPLERIAQLHELNTYLSSFATALQALPDIVVYDDIEKLILQIYRPMNYSLQSAESGSGNVVNDIRMLATGAETLLWLDCQEEDQEHDPYDFLSSTDKEILTQHGCVIPDFAEHLKTCRKERLRLLGKCHHIVLVRSMFDGTTRLGEHSMVAELRQAFRREGKELSPSDAATIFSLIPIKTDEAAIEIFQPVKYLELGTIDYPGRRESNTSLDTLINFPFNYVMQYVAKLPQPDEEQINNTFVTTGLVAHNFFEHIVADGGGDLTTMRRLTEDEYDERLEAAIDATGLILRLRENASNLTLFRRQLKDSMLSLITIMEKKGWMPVGCEMPFPEKADGSLEFDHIGAFGARIDFLLKEGDRYVIIDFKWSYSKKYAEALESNTAIQLELYRQAVRTTYPDKEVAGVGYYLMPKQQLITTDFEEIPSTKLIRKIEPSEDQDLFAQIQNSYAFRMGELRNGHIEEAETLDVMDDEDGYYAHISDQGLCPLNVEEKTEGRGKNRVIVSAKKKSEQVFRPTKKTTFEKKDAEPSEIATSHPILKGRLK